MTFVLMILAASVLLAACQAHRLGNEGRDTRLLAVVASLLGAGSAVSALA